MGIFTKINEGFNLVFEKTSILYVWLNPESTPDIGGCKLAINLFLANVPILYPLKTPENLWFSSVFSRYKMGTLTQNRLSIILFYLSKYC